MIAAVAFLRRYALPIGIALVLGIAWAWHRVEINAARRQGYAQAQAEGKDLLAKREAEIAAAEAEQREISRAHEVHFLEVSRDLQSRVDSLSRRNLDLGRLQVRTRCPKAAGEPAATPVLDAGTWDDGHALPPAADPASDLGAELLSYAAECERYRLSLKSLQEWVASIR